MPTIRFKYKKTDELKYIAHLDTLRVFTRAIRRAKLPVAYSQGFNPHPLIAFLMPLSLGFTSNCEYVDIGFTEVPENLAKTLDSALPDGFVVLEGYEPKDKPVDITGCLYSVTFENEISEADIDKFFKLPELIVEKKSKRGINEVDILPLVFGYSVSKSCLNLTLAAGTEKNLNPELLLKNMPMIQGNPYQICREKIISGNREFR